MRPLLVLWILLVFAPLSEANSPAKEGLRVFFSVKTPELEAGEKVLVMGNFNQWKGEDYKLEQEGHENIFKAGFEIPKEAGDTLEYKYVIQRRDGSLYWEKRPDPSNTPYGNRRAVLGDLSEDVELPLAEFQFDAYLRWPVVLRKDQMQADFLQMRELLEQTHPALYDYTPKVVMDSVFDHAFNRIGGDWYFRDYLCLLSSVVSRVGCGHSSMWVPGDYWHVAPEGLFPLQLSFSGEVCFVVSDLSGKTSIPAGSRIMAVNGRSIEQIRDTLMALTSADGHNAAYRLAMVEKNFSVKYALLFGFFKAFEIDFIPFGEQDLRHVAVSAVDKGIIDNSGPQRRDLDLQIMENGVAILDVPTFGYYGRVEEFRAFMDSCFRMISLKNIQGLVLDLRGNNGGDPFCAAVLLSYLEKIPVPYFEDHYGRYDTLANPIPLSPYRFDGRFCTLIDGRGFSTTGHFCALLDYHHLGVFVGSELGATYTCTGNATYPALDETRIMLGTARKQRYTVAVQGMDPRRGVIPDYPVKFTAVDIVSGRDPVMDKALWLLLAD